MASPRLLWLAGHCCSFGTSDDFVKGDGFAGEEGRNNSRSYYDRNSHRSDWQLIRRHIHFCLPHQLPEYALCTLRPPPPAPSSGACRLKPTMQALAQPRIPFQFPFFEKMQSSAQLPFDLRNTPLPLPASSPSAACPCWPPSLLYNTNPRFLRLGVQQFFFYPPPPHSPSGWRFVWIIPKKHTLNIFQAIYNQNSRPPRVTVRFKYFSFLFRNFMLVLLPLPLPHRWSGSVKSAQFGEPR